jgi:hypothetical protein
MASSTSNGFLSWFDTASIITGAVLGAVAATIKIFKKKKTSEEENKQFIQVHSEIHETLTELRVKTDAARAQIIQFHNGEYFMDGVSMRKFSLTHESLARGMSADSFRIKSLLCSMFLPLLNFIVENDPKIQYVGDMPHSFCKQFFEDNNVEGFSVLPIKIKNQITGFVLVQWCNINKLEALVSEDIKECVQDARSAIEVQLAQQKKG